MNLFVHEPWLRDGGLWLPRRKIIRPERYLNPGVIAGGYQPPITLTTGLLAYYKFDEASGTRVDATGNGHDLTSNNGVGSGTGILNNGANFVRASSQSLTCATTAPLKTLGSAFSISFWANVTDISTRGTIISNINGNAAAWIAKEGSGNTPDAVRITIDNFATGWLSSGEFTPGRLDHFVVVYDPTKSGINALVVYRNGNIRSQITAGSPIASSFASGSNNLTIGNGVSGYGFLDGLLDEFGIWNRALTQSEVLLLYNEGVPQPYPFTFFDSSTVIVRDNFNDTNGTILTSHAIDTINTGSLSWTDLTGGGGAHIQSNDLLQDATGIATLDSGTGDITITYTGTIGFGPQDYKAIEIFFRIQDTANYLWFHIKYSGDFVFINQIANVEHLLVPDSGVAGASWNSSVGSPNTADHVVVLKIRGNRLRGYIDGQKLLDCVTTIQAGNTKYGIGQNVPGANSLNAICRTFEVRTGEQFPPYPYPLLPYPSAP
jgi:Concanavalin A-like lectin/glucanases superfamily